MNRPGPAPERGGTPDALASLRKGGLKKARGTSVIADMTAPQPEERDEGQRRERLHSVPAIEESPAEAPAPVAPVQHPDHDQTAVIAPAQADPVPQAPFVQVPPAQQQAPVVQQTQPVAPVPQQLPAYAQPLQPVQYAPQPVQAPAPAQQPASEPPAAEKKTYRKTSFFQSKESGARMRSAYMATRHLTRSRTLSDFILAAVEREVEALEKRYNEGNVFDADPGSVPRGRPLES